MIANKMTQPNLVKGQRGKQKKILFLLYIQPHVGTYCLNMICSRFFFFIMWQLGPILSKISHFYHLHLHFFVAKITKFGPSQNQPPKNVVFTMVLVQVLFHPRPFSTSPNINFGMKVNNIFIFFGLFPSMVDDTHIIGLVFDVFHIFDHFASQLGLVELVVQLHKFTSWSPCNLLASFSLFVSFYYCCLIFLILKRTFSFGFLFFCYFIETQVLCIRFL